MGDIEIIKKEYNALLQQLSDPELVSNGKEFEEILKKKICLGEIIAKEKEIEGVKNQIEENKEILSAERDPELISLAEEEIKALLQKKGDLEKELEGLLVQQRAPLKDKDPQSVIVEIRAGVGGQESSLFVADLFRMYSKYADLKGWGKKILDSHPTELGGFKEIIFELKNGNVFSKMKYEGGVHRVQRIPETEKSGRIHTSTSSVAVLPKPKKAQIQINPKDLKIDFYCASGPGGQYVQKRHTAVRITHLPTGLVVTSQTARNQLQNKENAMSILGARILEKREREQIEKMGRKRKAQIGWAQRAEKIRTYNFPQDRVTDHRIKKSWHHIEEIMNGKLDPMIKSLQKETVDV